MMLKWNNKNIELPKMTLEIEENIENVKKVKNDGVRIYLETMLQCVENILTEDIAKEMLQYNDIEDIDTMELRFVFDRIVDTYNSPMFKKQTEEAKKATTELKKVIDAANIQDFMKFVSAAKQ